MKTLLMMLVACVAFSTAVSAQETFFGIKLGYNAANFMDDDNNDYRLHSSFNIGGLAHIHLSKWIALQPELMYSGQGTKFSVGNNDLRYHLDYVNVPVLVQFMTNNGFRFETGPQLGLLLAAHAKTGKVSSDIKSSFKSTDFSWAFGVGYITASRFGFDVRYNLGVSDITTANSSSVRNSVIQAGVFYQFAR